MIYKLSLDDKNPNGLEPVPFFDFSELSKIERFNPEQYESKYYQLLLNGFQITGFFASSKAGVNNTFNQSELENLWVMVPTLQEQREIADYLNRELKQIDKMISKIEHSIATLREYRITLISAAVTGKIDVRGVTV